MIIIYVTCKNLSEAQKIANSLIGNKLAVCVNIIPQVYSYFRWNGKHEKTKEALLFVKTDLSLRSGAVNQIKKIHSYKMPDIISWDADFVPDEITGWLQNEIMR